MQAGLVPRELKPGEQIQVGPEVLKNATPKVCECGCKYFIPVVSVFTVSALVSPIGKELTAQQPVLICLDCKAVMK
jgi:hypothetical protein